MKNARRGKRRKNPSRKRSRRAVQALAAGAMIAAGTQAYGDPIRFDNPPGAGHFDWAVLSAYIPLDVMLPAGAQPGDPLATSAFEQYATPGASFLRSNTGASDLQVGGPYGNDVVGVDAGELIPSGFAWASRGYTYYPGYGSQLAEGQPTYLGVRFDLGSGDHYGWIGVVRTATELDAFAWGYETEAGVPIPAGIPEPGTLAALALGAAAVLAGRRRVRSQID